MITSLSIKNYALIEDIRVDFDTGLTIITGETGAGKSILLGALGLVVGNRADVKVVKDTTKKCVIEACFSIANYNLKSLFTANDLDYEAQTIMRREILPSGKSRAFVNDTPVTLHQMQALGVHLIDVHSQHDTQTLGTEAYQFQIIDALAQNDDLLKDYAKSLREYRSLKKDLTALIAEKDQAVKELDYHSFLYQELAEANLASLDQLALEESYEKLNNTETIQEALAKTLTMLSNDEMGGITRLSEARSNLGEIANFSVQYESLWKRLNSVVIELEDIVGETEMASEQLEADPEKLFAVNDKLQILYKLQQKHTVATVKELIDIEENLGEKVASSTQIDSKIEDLQDKLVAVRTVTLERALHLNDKRRGVFEMLKQKLETLLKDLGLPFAQFQFKLDETEDFKPHGNASLQWLFTANQGTTLGPLQKVASGGEMSRIMLAVKAILTRYKNLATLVFDEIDTGVSGEIAHKMAEIMSIMSTRMQVVSITHLPQIAAKGDFHKRVFKKEENEVTTTQIKELSTEERVIEIAQMIGGSSLSESAIAHAKQLLN
ncbi:MAG: DNA repair protein RecN [Bacteroidetes bacterium]|nr:DNA repair protein RecN [Bacteroidota bacterium]